MASDAYDNKRTPRYFTWLFLLIFVFLIVCYIIWSQVTSSSSLDQFVPLSPPSPTDSKKAISLSGDLHVASLPGEVGSSLAGNKDHTLNDQFRLLDKDESVPPGTHVRMDLQTGQRWAKVADGVNKTLKTTSLEARPNIPMREVGGRTVNEDLDVSIQDQLVRPMTVESCRSQVIDSASVDRLGEVAKSLEMLESENYASLLYQCAAEVTDSAVQRDAWRAIQTAIQNNGEAWRAWHQRTGAKSISHLFKDWEKARTDVIAAWLSAWSAEVRSAILVKHGKDYVQREADAWFLILQQVANKEDSLVTYRLLRLTADILGNLENKHVSLYVWFWKKLLNFIQSLPSEMASSTFSLIEDVLPSSLTQPTAETKMALNASLQKFHSSLACRNCSNLDSSESSNRYMCEYICEVMNTLVR